MKISRRYLHEYVCCLPKEIQTKIMKNVKRKIKTLLLTEEERKEVIENANYSKVCDLTDTINIQFV